jgi:RNA polymerase sigma factor (sigma-70 family)
MHADTTDPDLVTQALDGDRAALAAIYDRYADRVHDLCRHMLGDADEAADVCGQVFLVAFSRLGQLRDPQRLRSWLFAIARHEVYRRSRQRSRTRLVEGVEQMDRLMAEQAQAGTAASDADDQVDVVALVAVLRAAADGLDDRDRMVMELQLQGLDGDELAAALGTSVSTGYQQVHRMKERLERSVGALLVARQGRADCDELDRVLSGWDGTFSVLWRKRVARHVDRCEVCERRRKAIPAALFGGTAAALRMVPVSAVGAAPAAVRDRVLSDAAVGTVAGGRGWRSDGFPSAESGGRRTAALVAAGLVLLLLAAVGLFALVGDDTDELVAVDAVATTTSAITSTTLASTTTTAVPETSAVPPGTVAPPAPTSTVATPTTTAPPPAAPPSPTVTTTVEPGPQVELRFVPRVLYHPTPGFGSCGASTEVIAVAASTAVRVELWWRDPSGADGTVQMASTTGEWRAVVELPEQQAGPVTLLAVAFDAQGRTGVSGTEQVSVQSCPTPG